MSAKYFLTRQCELFLSKFAKKEKNKSKMELESGTGFNPD